MATPIKVSDNKKEDSKITKLYKDTFNNDIGRKCIAQLEKTFVDRPVYIPGISHEETAYREGQRNVIMQIMKEISDGR